MNAHSSAFGPLLHAWDNRLAAARAAHATGQPVVGYVGNTVPVELIAASGCFPVRIAPVAGNAHLADDCIENFSDLDTRLIFANWRSGAYDFMRLLIVPRSTEPLHKLYLSLREGERIGIAGGGPPLWLYRPADLGKLGTEKLPIVAWGSGACVNAGNRFRYFLTEIASHGFIAVALGPMVVKEAETAGSGSAVVTPPAVGSPAAILAAAAGPNAPPPKIPGPAHTTAAQLSDAINWAISENARAGSPYFGRIATDQIAVMGQSCGGLQAIDIARRDPRVKTLGVWNSGLFPNEARAGEIAAAYVAKADLKRLHGTAIYVTGEVSDQAFPNANDDVERIDGIPVFRAWREQTGHSGTYREPNGGAFGKVAVAWLRWQLKGDRDAAKDFVGADCGLCRQPEWHVSKKRID